MVKSQRIVLAQALARKHAAYKGTALQIIAGAHGFIVGKTDGDPNRSVANNRSKRHGGVPGIEDVVKVRWAVQKRLMQALFAWAETNVFGDAAGSNAHDLEQVWLVGQPCS